MSNKIPFKNFFSVPNMLWDIDDLSVYEKWVLLYIIRHTWGFHEYDVYKTITIDEFMHGRKLKNGNRIDSGCGVSRGAVSNALSALEEKGYIAVQVNDSDKARVKKSYMLLLLDNNEGSSDERGVHDMNSRVHQMNPYRERHLERHSERQVTSDKSDVATQSPPDASDDTDSTEPADEKSTDSSTDKRETNWQQSAALAWHMILNRKDPFPGADAVPDRVIKRGLKIRAALIESYPDMTISEISGFAAWFQKVKDYTARAPDKVLAEFAEWRVGNYTAWKTKHDYQQQQQRDTSEPDSVPDDRPTGDDLIRDGLSDFLDRQRQIQDEILREDSDD